MKFIVNLIVLLTLTTTTTLYAQWNQQLTGTSRNLNEVFFPSENIGYILPYNGPLYRTLNGGATWDSLTSITLSTPSLHANYIWFINDSVGYITSNNNIYQTTNMGVTWNDITPDSVSGTIKDIHFVSELKGYFYSYGITEGELWTTVNGGQSWAKTSLAYPTGTGTSTLPAILFVDENTGYYTGGDGTFNYKGVIARTADAGNSWTYTTLAPNTLINSIHFPSKDTGYILTRNGNVYRSRDAGASWDSLSQPFQGNNSGTRVFFITGNIGYIVSGNKIFKTMDAGETWSADFTGGDSIVLNSIRTSPNAVYVVGSNGILLKNDLLTSTGPITPHPNQMNVYPNPSFGNFHFTIEGFTDKLKLEVRNLSGQVVILTDLPNKNFTVNLDHQPAGVYIYKVSGSGMLKLGKLVKQ